MTLHTIEKKIIKAIKQNGGDIMLGDLYNDLADQLLMQDLREGCKSLKLKDIISFEEPTNQASLIVLLKEPKQKPKEKPIPKLHIIDEEKEFGHQQPQSCNLCDYKFEWGDRMFDHLVKNHPILLIREMFIYGLDKDSQRAIFKHFFKYE